ncbi:alpha/beta hydrolase [Lactobacillus sp. ESL0681]|uniref:alpha/beta hydrolase n=1 Tax=Lactobacillus sp. ESL0681 TaxID=2983211 RepID=UPI0023F6C838|nr:alpha/beta hydrolase [Lactobacillus sp. ESL0681]WEV39512.1 alpha/beta hydrolase [Lactobacillus sp. ESL0681]
MTRRRKILISSGLLILLLIFGGLCWYKAKLPIENQTYVLQGDRFTSVGKIANRAKSTPTIYLHGWGASGRSTAGMIAYAVKHDHARKVLTVTVQKNGKIHLQGNWPKTVKRPIIQVVMQDNKNSDYFTTSNWIYHLMLLLKQKYHIKQYNTVAHSMGNLTLAYYQERYGVKQSLPKLVKQVSLGGHFAGIIGVDDQVNHNYLQKNGCPRHLNDTYRYLLRHRENFPTDVQVLNIYGNKQDGTNSDGSVSVVSARSLRYLLHGKTREYEEVEIKGADGQHSKLHENPHVNRRIGQFLWPK